MRSGPRSSRLARLLLRLAPPAFRADLGRDVEALFAERWRDGRKGLRGARLRAGLAIDLLVTAVREWRDELASELSPSRPNTFAMIRHDLKHLARWLSRSPAFAASALATLAAGVGLTTAIFAVFYGVLLRPLPFEDPDRLAFITRDGDVSVPDGIDWRARSKAFESIGLFGSGWNVALTGLGHPEALTTYAAEPEFFRVLRLEPLRGRIFTAAENVPNGPRLILVTEGFWRSHLSSDPNVVGRQLTLNGEPTTIIGLLPDRVDFLDRGIIGVMPLAVAMPWAPGNRGTNNLDAIGRIRADVDFVAARRELTDISTALAEEYPQTNRGKIVDPLPMAEFLVGSSRAGLWIALAAVGTLLLIAAVNLAGLLLARVAARRQELAVRAALGAGRRRIARQLLIEGLALAAVGGGLGLATGAFGIGVLRELLPASLPRTASLAFRGPVLGFGLAMVLVSGLVCGVLPALRGLRTSPLGGLASTRGSSERGRHRTLRAVVATEIALAVALLAAAGVLAKSFRHLWSQPLGFEPTGVLTASLVLPSSRYGDRDLQTRTYAAVVDQLGRIPGVTHAAFSITTPLSSADAVGNTILFENRPDISPEHPVGARIRPVYGDYFAALRIPIVRGRAFTPADDGRAVPVAIINQQMATHFFADRDPLGQRIALRDWHELTPGPVWLTIVGVASDVKATSLAGGDQLAIYMPYVQRQVSWQGFGSVVIRARGDPASYAEALKAAVWAVDPDLAVNRVTTLDQRRSAVVGRERFLAVVVALFAGSAVLLVVQGLWGVVSYAVTERRREIGVRVALGALAPDVIGLVTREALGPMAVGAAIGLALALAGAGVLRSALFEVSPTDPAVLAGTVALLLAVAGLASALPAWRATRIDPLEAMRAE